MNRAALIKTIHIGKKQLGLDTDTYRQMLLSVTGINSAGDMNLTQLKKVLDAMRARGFVVRPGKKARSSRPLVDTPQVKKLRALWLEMHQQGKVRDSSEVALQAWVKRETGVDKLQWLEPGMASLCIEKLKKWQKRPSAGSA
ncbi:regulatory protein GemA [Salmonella enterica subsp. enterica]|nr:regulatory protein GemA [Salmonella enterica subsp. enterica serovar Bonariensis]EEA7822486.1 regulatory protein GemA [Salmonella enterica subsp. enterica serovar Miami]